MGSGCVASGRAITAANRLVRERGPRVFTRSANQRLHGGNPVEQVAANFDSGNLSQALADFNQSSEINPQHAYAALWRDIVDRRGNQPCRLVQSMTQIDMTKWPAPVI
jgi:hypothetical protein